MFNIGVLVCVLQFFIVDVCAQQKETLVLKRPLTRPCAELITSGCVQIKVEKEQLPDEDDHVVKKGRHVKEDIQELIVTMPSGSAGGHLFIYDQYTSRRGKPTMLKILCKKCDAYVMNYQKDGPGRLLRCYFDRIHHPEELKIRQYQEFNLKRAAFLHCASCRSTIGVPIIYKLENRSAYKMLENKFYFKTVG